MKFGVVNKSTVLNRFVRHTLQRNCTHLAVITRKTNIKLGILKGGTGKEPNPPSQCFFFHCSNLALHLKTSVLIGSIFLIQNQVNTASLEKNWGDMFTWFKNFSFDARLYKHFSVDSALEAFEIKPKVFN